MFEEVDPDCTEELTKLFLIAFNILPSIQRDPLLAAVSRFTSGHAAVGKDGRRGPWFSSRLPGAVAFNTSHRRIQSIRRWMLVPRLDHTDYSKFSFSSNVFSLDKLIWGCCFYDHPPPLRHIFVACTREKPEDRSSLTQLRAMYEAIGSSSHLKSVRLSIRPSSPP